MTDIKQIKIYKIFSDNGPLIYYGSTSNKLNYRLSQHIYDYEKYKNGIKRKVYSSNIFEAYGVDNCKIELVEIVHDSTKRNERERYYIDNNECVNKSTPGRTQKEWYNNNIEKKKQYQEANKETIKQYKLEKHQCECGGKYITAGKARHIKSSKHQKFMNSNIVV